MRRKVNARLRAHDESRKLFISENPSPLAGEGEGEGIEKMEGLNSKTLITPSLDLPRRRGREILRFRMETIQTSLKQYLTSTRSAR